jgi:hypothetical protein
MAATGSTGQPMGHHALGAAGGLVTNGTVPPVAPAVAIGFVLKPAGTTGGGTDTGTATRMGILVQTHANIS